MRYLKWLDLQLFAEGGDGGGEGAAAGDNAVDAGQQRLLELGVPAEKIRKRAKKPEAASPGGAVLTQGQKQQAQQDAAAANEEASKTDTPSRMSWDEIMADPEYNKEMQAVVKARLNAERAKADKDSESKLQKLAPALEVMARKYGMDVENLDYEALAQAVNNDKQYYEDKAIEMGVSTETAMEVDQKERTRARQEKEEARTLEQQKIAEHIQKLEQQGEAMKATFPNFDLRKELQNPAFARMTSPNVGVSVEDAYYAVHRREIQAAAMQVTAQKTAQKISNSIQAGQRRPAENGTSGQAASVTSFDYSKASKAEREALKQRIRAAAARGEKIYPGR